jgi:hypothetical protein
MRSGSMPICRSAETAMMEKLSTVCAMEGGQRDQRPA